MTTLDPSLQLPGRLLGVVDVIMSMNELNDKERKQFSEKLFALIKFAHDKDLRHKNISKDLQTRRFISQFQILDKYVTLKLSEKKMHLFTTDENTSKITCIHTHALREISLVNAFSGNSGYMLYIGRCSDTNNRVAVVLDVYTTVNANYFIHKFRQMKNGSVYTPVLEEANNIENFEALEINPGNGKFVDDHVYENVNNFYETVGLDLEEQKNIYFTQNTSTPSSLLELNNHLEVFVENEYKYLTKLHSLVHEKKSLDRNIQHLFSQVDVLYNLHCDIYKQFSNNIQCLENLCNVLLDSEDNLKVYIYFICNSKTIDHHLNQYGKKYSNLLSNLVDVRKRLHYYFQMFESLIGKSSNKFIVDKTIEMLRNIYRQADTELVIDAIKGITFDLHKYVPLILQDSFYIQGSHPQLKKTELYHTFLFKEVIVITENCRSYNKYVGRMFLEQIYLLDCTARSNRMILELNEGGIRSKETFIFTASSDKVISEWTKAISNFHIEYMKNKRERKSSFQ